MSKPSPSSDIPRARALLELQRSSLKAALKAVEKALTLMRRTRVKKRTAAKSAPVSPELLKKIAAHAKDHPSQSAQEVAAKFGVNQGRVTDALRKYGD